MDRVFDFAGLHKAAKVVEFVVCVFVGPLGGPVFGGFELDRVFDFAGLHIAAKVV